MIVLSLVNPEEMEGLSAANTSWEGQTCPIPLSALDFLHDFTLPDMENIWPCEARFYWLKIQPFVKIVRFLLAYVTAFIIVIGLTLNTVSFCLLNTPVLNDSSLALYLKALSISDNGALIFNYAVSIARSHSLYVNEFFMNSKFLCGMNSVTLDLFQFTSTWLVVALTWARVTAVMFPLHNRNTCHGRSSAVTIIILSSLTLILSLTKLYFGGFESDSAFGYQACRKAAVPWGCAMYFYSALSTWLPLLFIFIGNCLLFSQVRKSAKIRSRLNEIPVLQREGNLMCRTSKTLLAVSVVSLILMLPIGIAETLELYWDVVLMKKPATKKSERAEYINWLEEKMLLKWCRALFFHLYHWNFAMNFFLYYLTGKKFRSGVLRAFGHYKKVLCLTSVFHWPNSWSQRSGLSTSSGRRDVSLIAVINLHERPVDINNGVINGNSNGAQ